MMIPEFFILLWLTGVLTGCCMMIVLSAVYHHERPYSTAVIVFLTFLLNIYTWGQ